MSVIWHDLECGGYTADLPLWRRLAADAHGPILDVGAGTGRVTVELAGAGHTVTGLDNDDGLLAELRRRAEGLPVTTACADARTFAIDERFGLILVPMQTVQLLGGPAGRAAFLARARSHLVSRGRLAIALAEELEPFEVAAGAPGPLPDVCERDGVVYSSWPTAVRADGDCVWLERERETVTAEGVHSAYRDRIALDVVSAATVEREAATAGLTPLLRHEIAATGDHVGSRVVIVGG